MLDYPNATATQLASALRRREVSAVELAQTAVAEIEARDGAINAVVVRDFDRALEAAKAADAALTAGREGALLGVPMTVKESYDLTGYPTTWGMEACKDHRAQSDAVAVQRLKAAGAVILGKTNVPPMLADWQSANPVYGRTNNPHDLTRSPGGSSGGGAAALAAGFVPLELGSDIGGSIRIPAAFCGVFGHKSSYGIVPTTGSGMGGMRYAPPPLAVSGPLARSAADLDLALGILAGPDGEAAKGYRLDLPAPRFASLKGARLLILDRHPKAPASAAVRAALDHMAIEAQRAGAKVQWDNPRLPDLPANHRTYVKMLTTYLSRREGYHARTDAHEWLTLVDEQDAIRRDWAALFETVDAVVLPAFGTVAFPHDEEPDWRKRTLLIDGAETRFGDQFAYAGIATLPNLPSTAFPIGFDDGLPIGAQAIGPFLEDRTTIALAGLLAGLLKP